MTFSWTRVGAIFQKELRDYRRNRFVVFTMSLLPLVFIAAPMIQLFAIKVTSTSARLEPRLGLSLLFLLILPALIPSILSAYSVVGEREQGTLEPILTTPIHREEFLIGKALAALLPTLALSYLIFGIFLAAVALFAQPVVASAVFEGSHVLVQLLFTPLVAGWSIWVGIAISTRVGDVRAAQQLTIFAALPPVAVVTLMSLNVIAASLGLALGLAAFLIVIDGLAWRVLATMFDRERLITGSRAAKSTRVSPGGSRTAD
ncbi:MAG TPA: ABC transporter permease [Candidatus Dormibacteraeota bacterium]|nr:ABC transporter permease [Candidatus Dormibacteraeota bacterium]